MNLARRQALPIVLSPQNPFTHRQTLASELCGELDAIGAVVIKSFFKTGKTQLASYVLHRYVQNLPFPVVSLALASRTVPGSAYSFFLDAAEFAVNHYPCVYLDELCVPVPSGSSSVDNLRMTDFKDFLSCLSGLLQYAAHKGIKLILSIPRVPNIEMLEESLGKIRIFPIPIRLNEDEARRYLSEPFEDTGVTMSDSTKQAIIFYSSAHPLIMCELVSRMLAPYKNHILYTREGISIDEDPQSNFESIITDLAMPNPSDPRNRSRLDSAVYFFDSMTRCLSEREKQALGILLSGTIPVGYGNEIDELVRWSVVDRTCDGFVIPNVVRRFAEFDLFTEAQNAKYL